VRYNNFCFQIAVSVCLVFASGRVILFAGIREWQFLFPGFPGARE